MAGGWKDGPPSGKQPGSRGLTAPMDSEGTGNPCLLHGLMVGQRPGMPHAIHHPPVLTADLLRESLDIHNQKHMSIRQPQKAKQNKTKPFHNKVQISTK